MLNLITKLFEKKYGCYPTNQVESAPAPDAPKETKVSKNFADDDSDDYDDDFDTDLMGVDKKKDAEKKGKNADAEEEDEWGLDEDWGDLDDIKDKSKKGGAGAKPTTIMDDLDDLDDLPEIGSNYPG